MRSGAVDRRPPAEAALVVHPARARAGGSRDPAAGLEEASGLAEALDLDVRERLIAPLREAAPATLFGAGKVAEIADIVRAAGIGVVVVDDALSPVQQRNLERAWQAKVVDRTGLILEIFAKRARTREGRLQVELARLDYERSRLVRTWTHLERQRGGFGFLGGPGETQIEADRRLLLERMVKLKADLAEVRRTRGLQRRARRRAPYPTVAVVGYTNAGKSTLFNRLTGAKVVARDLLFATLDPTLRRLELPGGRPAILSDTVGFISDLPHQLVDAFRATLEEVREADLIVHVRDIAGPHTESHRAEVEKVLREIGVEGAEPALAPEAGSRRVLEVWNKADLLSGSAADEAAGLARSVGAVLISAATGQGLDGLRAALAARIDDGPEVVLALDPGDGEALSWLYRHGRVVSRREGPGDLVLHARLDAQALGRFERMRPGAVSGAVSAAVSGAAAASGGAGGL